MKIPKSLKRKLSIRIIIYLDDMLLMEAIIKEFSMSHDALEYLLQSLGILINIQKSVLNPT